MKYFEISKFIDAEAQDSDDDFEDLEEDDLSDGLVDGLVDAADGSAELVSKRPRIDEQRPPVNAHKARMDDLAEVLAEKYGGINVDSVSRDADSPVQRLFERDIRKGDWPLWRVKCASGVEYDVLFQLISKWDLLSSELRSAFTNPRNPNTIYLEAHFIKGDSVGSLFHLLRTLSSVKVKTLTVVPEDERAACFGIRNDSNQVLGRPGEWVKVNRGLYKGDVGVVVDSFDNWGGRQGSEVALVPRLPAIPAGSQKRTKPSCGKQRPQPKLFDPLDCAEGALLKTETGYILNHWKFEDGLILKSFHTSSLEPARFMPSGLLSHFRLSKHPLIRPTTMPIPDHWCFEAGERVLVSPNGTAPIIATIVNPVNMPYRGLYVVGTDEGDKLFSPLDFTKCIVPGDFVEICAGDQSGKMGFVVSRNGALLSIAPGRFGAEPHMWAHINSVKLGKPPVAPVSIEPWIELEVQIMTGKYAAYKGVIKNVRPDGKGSLRLAVYVPEICNTLELDVFAVSELHTRKMLFDYQPLQPHQHMFKVLPELRAMRTGRLPWEGMKVDIVAGHYKGQGIVRDVNRYQYEPRRPTYTSGLQVTVERLVMTATGTGERIKVDYNHLRYHRTHFKLADIFYPSKQQSLFYLPLDFDARTPAESTRAKVDSQTPAGNFDNGSRTPPWEPATEFEQAHVFTGEWSAQSFPPNISVWGSSISVPWNDPSVSLSAEPGSETHPVANGPSVSLSAEPGSETHLVAEQETPTESHEEGDLSHWILHPNLLGIAIRVNIQGGQKQKKSGVFVKTIPDSGSVVPVVVNLDKGNHSVSPLQIVKFHDRPKPTSERSLMVVIEGPHTGKFVRQIYHFYRGARGEKNAVFIALVMDRSGQIEQVSQAGEYLELDRNEVELVQETGAERRYMNQVLKDLRDSWRATPPEVRT